MLEFANGVEMNTIEGIEHQSYELFTPFKGRWFVVAGGYVNFSWLIYFNLL